MCYPWMIEHLIDSISRCCVNADHLANKILNLGIVNMLSHHKGCSKNLFLRQKSDKKVYLITSVIPITVVKIKFALCNISIQFCMAIHARRVSNDHHWIQNLKCNKTNYWQTCISCIAIWIKGMVSTDQDKKDDTKTPHINLGRDHDWNDDSSSLY